MKSISRTNDTKPHVNIQGDKRTKVMISKLAIVASFLILRFVSLVR